MKVKGRGRFREVEDPDGFDYTVLVQGSFVGCVQHGEHCDHAKAVRAKLKLPEPTEKVNP